MVLLMFAYRSHQKWNAQTSILFDPVLNGSRVWIESSATVDGQTYSSGRQLNIGWHTLTVTHPKTKSYRTNLFVWYGVNDLGAIALERATGTLAISANPGARLIQIQGPEFSLTLTNSSGMTSSVPTDRYIVEATYRHWRDSSLVAVEPGRYAAKTFAPKLGTLHIAASHDDASFQILGEKDRLIESGTLPVNLSELPEGNYRLVSRRKADQREMPVMVNAGVTNPVQVEFIYGQAVIASEPAGAAVSRGRDELGKTPLTLTELKPGKFEFMLKLDDYEPVIASLQIAADQTNSFRTNLVSRFYVRAMERADRLYAEKKFELAAAAAKEALTYKADDTVALRLQSEATGRGHLARAESLGQRGDYSAAIEAAKISIVWLPESAQAKTLLAELTRRDQERVEAEQKRQAEVAEQKRKQEEAETRARQRQQSINRLNTQFDAMNRNYKNAPAFSRHEMVVTNEAQSAATKINSALFGGQPAFEILKYEWLLGDAFMIQARQKIGIGYRECLIIGGNVQPGEMHVLYKVFEYENPPELKMLNGFLSAATSIKVTSEDPQVEQRKAERFQARIKEGVQLVKSRIESIQNRP
jgi:tetratricopeptide (TPR) repeat protein